MNNEKTRTITDLMSKLDREQNWNIFHIVDFLNIYSSDNNDSDVKIIMNNYNRLIRKINNSDYQKKTEEKISSGYNISSFENIVDIPKHPQMIDNFNNLPNDEQKNVIYLAWFILYCRLHKLDHPDKLKAWKRYSDLIEEIKNFSDNAWT